MQDFEHQISEIADAMGKVGVLSAMEDALRHPKDCRVAFRSAWVIAKSFFYLGENLSELQLISKAAREFSVNREDRFGSKMAFIDRESRQGIIAMTPKGSIVIYNDLTIELRGAYGKVDDSLRDLLSRVIESILLAGCPFITLCDILDRYHSEPTLLEEQLTRLVRLIDWTAE